VVPFIAAASAWYCCRPGRDQAAGHSPLSDSGSQVPELSGPGVGNLSRKGPGSCDAKGGACERRCRPEVCRPPRTARQTRRSATPLRSMRLGGIHPHQTDREYFLIPFNVLCAFRTTCHQGHAWRCGQIPSCEPASTTARGHSVSATASPGNARTRDHFANARSDAAAALSMDRVFTSGER